MFMLDGCNATAFFVNGFTNILLLLKMGLDICWFFVGWWSHLEYRPAVMMALMMGSEEVCVL